MIDDSLRQNGFSLAYETAVKSNDWAIRRIDTWDNNLDKFFGIGLPVVTGVIIQGFSRASSTQDWTFIAISIITLLLGGLIIWRGKNLTTTEGVWINDPNKLLNEQWLKYDNANFRFQMMKKIGAHFKHNQQLIGRKRKAANRGILLITISIILAGLVWVQQAQHPQTQYGCQGHRAESAPLSPTLQGKPAVRGQCSY
jgi:hypothetical protein